MLTEQRDAQIKSIALLKRNALAAPFERAFKEQKQLEASGSGQGELMALHYRDEEVIYVQASPDRVTVIFSTTFREETDRIFGKVFLQVSSLSICLWPVLTAVHRRSSWTRDGCRQYRAHRRSCTPRAIRHWKSVMSPALSILRT